jgi:hypothetical protein
MGFVDFDLQSVEVVPTSHGINRPPKRSHWPQEATHGL